jgi:hypothetical protein
VNDLEGLDRFHLQRYLGEAVRVSKKAIWMKRELSTHLESLYLFRFTFYDSALQVKCLYTKQETLTQRRKEAKKEKRSCFFANFHPLRLCVKNFWLGQVRE